MIMSARSLPVFPAVAPAAPLVTVPPPAAPWRPRAAALGSSHHGGQAGAPPRSAPAGRQAGVFGCAWSFAGSTKRRSRTRFRLLIIYARTSPYLFRRNCAWRRRSIESGSKSETALHRNGTKRNPYPLRFKCLAADLFYSLYCIVHPVQTQLYNTFRLFWLDKRRIRMR